MDAILANTADVRRRHGVYGGSGRTIQCMSWETDQLTIGELDVGMVFELPESHHREQHVGRTVEAIDYTSVGEYLEDGDVYAYADPESGEYLGLLNADLLADGLLTPVRLREP